MKRLEQMSNRMDDVERQILFLDSQRGCREDRANLEKELRDLEMMTLEDPASLRKRCQSIRERFTEYEDAKRACPAATCGWWCRSPRSIAIAAYRSST